MDDESMGNTIASSIACTKGAIYSSVILSLSIELFKLFSMQQLSPSGCLWIRYQTTLLDHENRRKPTTRMEWSKARAVEITMASEAI